MADCLHPPSTLVPLFPARDYVSGEPFEVRVCPSCGLALTWPPPGDPAGYYPSGYHRRAGARRFPALVEGLQGLLYARRARAVERLAGAPAACSTSAAVRGCCCAPSPRGAGRCRGRS